MSDNARTMSLSIWTPVDFFIGFGGSRRRLLEVPVITEERMSRDYKVVEVSWTLVFSVTMILDLKRLRFGRSNVLALRRIRMNDSCQPTGESRNLGRTA